jgi:tetratricopeptide (TPR) repeat protein
MPEWPGAVPASAIKTHVNNPYPGARPFRSAEQTLFFGRTVEAVVLRDLWQGNRLSIAIGAPATGKSSLLQAGALPLVTRRPFAVLPPGRITADSALPFAALPEHNPYTLALLRSWAPGEPESRLIGLTISEFIRERARYPGSTVLACIDQVEDLFADARPDWNDRLRFLQELGEALADENLSWHLLLVVREEGLAALPRELCAGARMTVTPLSPRDAVNAVVGPAAVLGRRFAPDAVDAFLGDIRTSRIVPPATGGERYVVADEVQPELLQIACAAFWDTLPVAPEDITVHDVRRYGGVDDALAGHYGHVVAQVAYRHGMAPARLRSWLLTTFVDRQGDRNSAYEVASETDGMPQSVTRALTEQHVLAAELRAGTRWYELLSERLIGPLRQGPAEWPPPEGAVGHLDAAERALALGDLDSAERDAKATLQAAPQDAFRNRARAQTVLGNCAWVRGSPRDAERRYQVAAELFQAVNDTSAVARSLAAVGQAMAAQGRLAEAVRQLGAAVERIPNDSLLQTELAVALWCTGDSRAAIAVLTSVLSSDGANRAALRARGEILADVGEARAAISDLDRVPLEDQPSTRAARALAIAELGDQATARREIETALIAAPRNGQVLLYAARATALSGDRAGAVILARRAVDATDPILSPQHREAALELAGGWDRTS